MVQTTLHVCSTCSCLFCITRILQFPIFHNLVQAGYFTVYTSQILADMRLVIQTTSKVELVFSAYFSSLL